MRNALIVAGVIIGTFAAWYVFFALLRRSARYWDSPVSLERLCDPARLPGEPTGEQLRELYGCGPDECTADDAERAIDALLRDIERGNLT